MALKVVFLQLPLIEYPSWMKGIYLTHDYSRNPIARRVVFVRQGNEIPLEEFAEMRTEVIPKDKLNEEQQAYYDYTCQQGDVIRSMMHVNDLMREKELLKLL